MNTSTFDESSAAGWLASDAAAAGYFVFDAAADDATTEDTAIEAAASAAAGDSDAGAVPAGMPGANNEPSAPTPGRQYNGNGEPVAGVAATGQQQIDGILSGYKWADGGISYSDPDSAADYGFYDEPGSLTGFSQANAQQMVAVHAALNTGIITQLPGSVGFSVEGFTNLSTTYNGSGTGNATIRVANSTDPASAYAYYPSASPSGGDAFFDTVGKFPDAGDFDWLTVLHELGHSLGLKHGHATDTYGALPSAWDTVEFSIMTYRTFVGDDAVDYDFGTPTSAPQTFMMLDVYALQYMYGVDYSTRSTSDTYTWTPGSGDTVINGQTAINAAGPEIFLTVWDGGGVDTYNLAAYGTNLYINLQPGQVSNFGQQLADLGGGPNGGFARANVYNAFQWGSDTRSLIENAIGGSGNDTIYGNVVANVLTGGGGNDYFLGYSGNDTFYGGTGNDDGNAGSDADTAYLGSGDDRMYGWTGNDFLYGEAGADRLIGDAGADRLDGGADNDRLYGGSGDDDFFGGAGADFIDGSGGNDRISGGGGADRLQGRQGFDDFFFEGPGTGADRIFGFEDDIDELYIDRSYGFNTAAQVVANSSASGNNLFINLNGGNSVNLWLFLVSNTIGDITDDIIMYG